MIPSMTPLDSAGKPEALRFHRCLIVAAIACGLTGCGYRMGGGFPPDVRTIEVPVFTSDSFRRDVEFQLTEAVQREIERRTHFRIVKGPVADTRLTGRIIEIRKDVLGENQFDDPRELQLSLAVEVVWEDLRSGRILSEQRVPIDPTFILMSSQASFAPEVGQSRATATHEMVQLLARDIVNRMETPW
jgi:hypothetical protein